MTPEDAARANQVGERNFRVGLVENLKKSISLNFSSLWNAIKSHTFSVKVENQNRVISVDNLVDNREDIKNSAEAIVGAIRDIPGPRDISAIEERVDKIVELLTPKPVEPIKMPKMPVFQSEEISYGEDGMMNGIVKHYDTIDICYSCEDREGSKIWTKTEVKK